MALQISKQVRPRLRLDEEPWAPPGKVRLPDVRAARLLAWRIHEALTQSAQPSAGVSAGALRALDVIEEALQRIARSHLEQRDPSLVRRSLDGLARALGPDVLRETLEDFSQEFLGGEPAGDEEATLELLILWIVHNNPAARSITRVLHESRVLERPQFQEVIENLTDLLQSEEAEPGPGGERLIDLLLGPQRASPDSLLGQLQFLLRRWGDLLEDHLAELQGGLDLFAEELAPRFGGGPGPAEVPSLSFGDDEVVRYSSDRNWMPSLVLLAKNVYVWLDQLSRRYGTRLRHLDDIPAAELERIAAHGVTGLWLIGVWERSEASQRIKQMCGNPEAVASAYSLRRYQIAEELGGEVALQHLKANAWEHGIRLAADMVPNHMGIDSDWVLEHPEWFLGDSRSPFPAYSFDGPDFSPSPEAGIYLEDHYFDRSDAAVVFKRRDHRTGEERYIYHGNDGTSMPWNDTAQLDYLQPAVREAVLETILDVARRFPVIRFDAAMTLARRHYQRLWFPEAGTAGAIPSRAEYGLSREEFHRLMPEEFWREVVDRVSTELPDTLLLAEAFWLMEGYFVRTLGMHRVYNSAFMNMLRDQENDKYRRLLKETLEFDPQILQRYVNFMSNPDEETAIEQFGKEDRYFGVCVMMATLPGLPMFAHGQFEGFAEKYGMEYRRAYWDEEVDSQLVARHEREVVPLLKRRPLFAGVENFRLFDLIDDAGVVNEDVFAYSNGLGDDRVVVVFNNRYQHAHGHIHHSAAVSTGAQKDTASHTLAQTLGTDAGEHLFVVCRDLIGDLQYLVDSRVLRDRGWKLDLGAFHYRVLVDFHEIRDSTEGLYARLAERLGCQGVEDLGKAARSLQLEPLRERWHHEVHPTLLATKRLLDDDSTASRDATEPRSELATALRGLAEEAATIGRLDFDAAGIEPIVDRLGLLPQAEIPDLIGGGGVESGDLLAAALIWTALRVVEEALGETFSSHSLLEGWSLGPEVTRSLAEMGVPPEATAPLLASVACSLDLGWGHQPRRSPGAAELLEELLTNEEPRQALQVHTFQGVEYLNREALETLLEWLYFLESWAWTTDADASAEDKVEESDGWSKAVAAIAKSAEAEGYRSDRLQDRVAEVNGETPGRDPRPL